MPSLLGDDYQKYMARRGSLIFLAQTLGPTIAAAVASFTTPALAVGFAGTLNLLAALTVATIRNYDLTHAERTATVQEHHTGRLLREGAAYTARNPIVRGMLTSWFLSIAAVPITTLPMLEYLTRDLGHDYTAFGIATSVYAAGCVISSWLSAKLGVGTGTGRVRITKRGWMCISGLGYGAVCLSMGLHPALWAVLVLWFIWGMFYGPEEVLGQVLFADAIDEHMRGRVYSFMGVVFSLAGMVGYLITGWAVPAFGAINTIVAGGSLFVIATVFTFILGPTAQAIRAQEARNETKDRAGHDLLRVLPRSIIASRLPRCGMPLTTLQAGRILPKGRISYLLGAKTTCSRILGPTTTEDPENLKVCPCGPRLPMLRNPVVKLK